MTGSVIGQHWTPDDEDEVEGHIAAGNDARRTERDRKPIEHHEDDAEGEDTEGHVYR